MAVDAVTPEELYMQNRPLIKIGLRIAGIDEPDEDWMQNGRMWLWKACLTYDPEKGYKFSTLAVTAVYRAAKNMRIYQERLRRRGSVSSLTHENEEGEDEQIDITDDDWDPDARLRLDDFWHAAEQKLKPRELDMLRMSAQGCTYADIGRAFGISTQRVSQIYKKRIRPIADANIDRRHSR
ncbi:MAG: sigma-70 family RNA polymerase sigma factor [Clostridia bacterium]|nr:sigma-70 family RNA polymerase sigma factor [Clostridia bacterium]